MPTKPYGCFNNEYFYDALAGSGRGFRCLWLCYLLS